ncbi:hypothetical protein [Rhodomicrobium vannielii]|uniref:hypothetical protein n=1 Tax=Rhodomicrobium vannielii TaxID=1069 RepID=UPI001AEC8ED7|nr:hypothetical protein [Rhodomicrobium vannielii]
MRINASKGAARFLMRHMVPAYLERCPRVELDLVSEGRLDRRSSSSSSYRLLEEIEIPRSRFCFRRPSCSGSRTSPRPSSFDRLRDDPVEFRRSSSSSSRRELPRDDAALVNRPSSSRCRRSSFRILLEGIQLSVQVNIFRVQQTTHLWREFLKILNLWWKGIGFGRGELGGAARRIGPHELPRQQRPRGQINRKALCLVP